MAGAMHELVTIPCLLDHAPRRLVGLSTSYRHSVPDSSLHQLHGRFPGSRDDLKDASILAGDFIAHETHPGEVAIDAVGCGLLGEQIKQDQITELNRRIVILTGTEMRVSSISIHCNYWRFIRMHPARLDSLEHETLNLI